MNTITDIPSKLLSILSQTTYSSALPCPVCQTIGFYGPKIAGERKYRACKFCGFWQEAPGESQKVLGTIAYRCTHISCPAGHEYDWVHPGIEKFKNCSTCGTNLQKTDWAIDNSQHYFHQLKALILTVLNS